ncbi:MAG TPA: VOC family protein [Thermoplasmata archaeon]|nr:VOC family protein [Thermoplasmata archaeon]
MTTRAPGKLWVGSVVIDCRRYDEMIAFWRDALGYERRDAGDGDFVVLSDPHASGPNLSLQRDPVGPTGTYWFHLDLDCSDPEAELSRLVALGARVRQPAKEGNDYVTLEDPDGNPFDVIDNRGFRFGQRRADAAERPG